MSFISSVASLWPELIIRMPGSGSCSGRTGRTINKSAYAGANLQLVMLIANSILYAACNGVGFATLSRLMLHILFNRQAVGNAAGKGHFIGILQFATEGYAPGYGSDLYRCTLKFFLNVIYGGIALDVRV